MQEHSHDENGHIRYSVKELLTNLTVQLQELNDKVDVRMVALENRVLELEKFRWHMPSVGFVAVIVAAAAIVVEAFLH